MNPVPRLYNRSFGTIPPWFLNAFLHTFMRAWSHAWYGMNNESTHKVEIYTTPTCAYCKMAKEFFKENGVEYTEYDVSQNQEKAQEMVSKTGMFAVPVIVVDGKETITGFDRNKLQGLLDIK